MKPLERQSGMTLIELLVAMSVLAVLSVMGYKAFSALLIAREHLMRASTQWIDLARTFRQIGRDLGGLPLPDAEHLTPSALRLDGGPETQRLTLTVFSPSRASGRDTLVYQQRSDGLSWSSLRAGGASERVFGADYRVRWRILLDDGRWVMQWPDTGGGMPRALEMHVEQASLGAVTRLWSLP